MIYLTLWQLSILMALSVTGLWLTAGLVVVSVSRSKRWMHWTSQEVLLLETVLIFILTWPIVVMAWLFRD